MLGSVRFRHERGDVLTDDLVLVVAEESRKRRIDRFDGAGFVDGDDRVDRCVEDRRQPRVLVEEVSLEPHALAQIPEEPHEEGLARDLNFTDREMDRDPRTVLANGFDVAPDSDHSLVARLKVPRDVPAMLRSIRLGHERRDILSHELFRSKPQHLLAGGIREPNAPRRVDGDDRVDRAVDDCGQAGECSLGFSFVGKDMHVLRLRGALSWWSLSDRRAFCNVDYTTRRQPLELPKGTLAMCIVLLIEPNPLYRWALQSLLEERGVQVVAAGTEVDGRELVEQRRFDVVLVDEYAEGFAGEWLSCQPVFPWRRLFVLTIFPTDEGERRAVAAGANGYIEKELDPRVLVEKVIADVDPGTRDSSAEIFPGGRTDPRI